MTNVFQARPPLEKALGIVDRDLKGRRVTVEELAWLKAHPLTWIGALDVMKAEVENHISKSRLGLASLRPLPGEPPTVEYLREKASVDAVVLRRQHFLGKIKSALGVAKSVVGFDERALLGDGDFIAALVKIERLLEQGDSDSALDSLNHWLDRVEHCIGLPAAHSKERSA